MKEQRIYGPPGTGKTTYLATKLIPEAVEKYGPDKVVITSFSRAAAKEIVSKKSYDTGKTINVFSEHVGTTHALCFHALGRPQLVVEVIDQWNNQYPDWAIKSSSMGSVIDEIAETGSSEMITGEEGASILGDIDIFRAKMIPIEKWDETHKDFFKKWTNFKNENMVMDFTDLIENAIKTQPYAPGQPKVIVLDEAQDATKLQLTLLRSWGMMANQLILVGDDQQCIFSFIGADARNMLEPILPKEQMQILSQSYRVPRKVHALAANIIANVTVQQKKIYKPRDAEGNVAYSEATFKSPDQIIELAKEYAQPGNDKTMMILTTCAYMLDIIKSHLRQNGIPFHNPYRTRRADWNPLRRSTKTSTSARDLLINFANTGKDNGYWNVKQFVTWASFLKTGPNGLKRKVGKKAITLLKEALAQNASGLGTIRESLSTILSPDAIQPAMDRNMEWFCENLQSARRGGINYPLEIYTLNNKNTQILQEKPKIIIGTIHSVKGGEGDTVVLFPDISGKAAREYNNSVEAQDTMYRLLYVGITRAKENLIICKNAPGSHFMEI